MKLWDVEDNEIQSLSKHLNIGKGSIVQIAGSGGKTSLTYALAKENEDLKCAILTTTKRFAPEDGYILKDDNEAIDTANIKGNFVEAGVLDDQGKIGWVGEDNYNKIKEWADLVIIEADGSKQLPIKACSETEPVFVPDATHTIVVTGMSALGQIMKDVCHRYHLVEHIYPHYKTVYPNEISALLRLFYQKRFKEIDIFYILNQCDGDAERIRAAKSILKACNFNGCYGSIIEQ